MRSALVGHTGFVGSNLARQREFGGLFNRANASSLGRMHYDRIVCAAAPAAKWIANRHPDEDRENISTLCDSLARARTGHLVLVSTVDVYPVPRGVDESSPIDAGAGEPYGRHRLALERFVSERFETTILRLPGLFGPGLKKNVIYDLLNDHDVDRIDSRGVFQFYDVRRLGADIDRALAHGIGLLNVASEPLTVAEVARVCLGRDFANEIAPQSAHYDFRSRHARTLGGRDGYLYGREQVLADLADFVQAQRAAVP